MPDGTYESFGGDGTTIIGFGTEIDISAGITSSGLVVDDFTFVNVLSGGIASATTVGFDGFVTVEAGGSAIDTTLTSFGGQTVSSGGFAIGTVVQSGGELDIARGGTASASIIESGGFELGFGNVSGTVVSSGGAILLPWLTGESIATLPTDQGVTLESGALLGVDIQVGASTTAFVVNSGTFEQVEGTTLFTIVEDGGSERVASGGIASGTIIQSGGSETVSAGGVAQNTVVDGGAMTIFANGSASGTIVEDGGTISVYGRAVNTFISNGSETLVSGGVATGTVIANGGLEQVGELDVASGSVILSGGIQEVTSGDIPVSASGGLALGITVRDGGTQKIDNGGSTSGNTIESGGTEIVSSGGRDLGGTVISAGGELFVSGGTASGTSIYGSALVMASPTSSGIGTGSTVSAQIENGGRETVSAGGQANASFIESGGILDVESGGSATATVRSGGSLVVNGGVVDRTDGYIAVRSEGGRAVVLDGGTVSVLSQGVAAATISSGGEMTVSSSGVVADTTILDGGLLVLEDGGAVAAGIDGLSTVVSSGGEMVVSSGGVVAGNLEIAGGLVVLSAGAVTAGQLFAFSGSGGTLEIDGTEIPNLEIAGFAPGDTIDLAGIGFAKGGEATLKSGNALHIVENGAQYELQLSATDTLEKDYTFQLSADQNGGTDITAIAADFWQGPSSSNRSGDWSALADWGNRHIPQDSDRAVLGGAGAYTVTTAKNREIARLTITDTAATLDVTSGTLTLSGPHGSRNDGTIEIDAGAAVVDHAGLVNEGTIAIDGGQLTVSGTFGGGGNAIIDGATLDLGGMVTQAETVSFASTSTGTLDLGKAQRFAGTVAGIAQGDAIDLENFAFSQAAITRVSGSGNVGTDTILTIKAGSITAHVALLNQYAGQFAVDPSAYALASDKHGTTPGTLLELAAPVG